MTSAHNAMQNIRMLFLQACLFNAKASDHYNGLTFEINLNIFNFTEIQLKRLIG